MKELLYEFLEEASRGEVDICGDKWPVAFNTIIEEEGKPKKELFQERNISTLHIKREEEFLEVLKEYLDLEIQKDRKMARFIKEDAKGRIKWLLMYLFSYATTEDFINPISYIHKRIDFLKDETFKDLSSPISISLGDRMLDTELEVQREDAPIAMETPNKINMTIKNKEGDSFSLPSIYYGIREENKEPVCYIYSLLNPKDKEEETKFSKKINRFLFKINNGVEHKEEEDIKDVSMSFVLALNIFISLLQKRNIKKIKVVNYLPISYLARDLTAENSERREELLERNQRIQENQTEKLIRTFRRLCVQNSAMQVETYPYELDEFLTLSLNERKKELDNMLIEETNRQIIEEKKM